MTPISTKNKDTKAVAPTRSGSCKISLHVLDSFFHSSYILPELGIVLVGDVVFLLGNQYGIKNAYNMAIYVVHRCTYMCIPQPTGNTFGGGPLSAWRGVMEHGLGSPFAAGWHLEISSSVLRRFAHFDPFRWPDRPMAWHELAPFLDFLFVRSWRIFNEFTMAK